MLGSSFVCLMWHEVLGGMNGGNKQDALDASR